MKVVLILRNKVYNPVTGKYMSLKDKVVLSLIISKAPDLVNYWKSTSSDVPFHEFLVNCENDVPTLKGAINKLIGKRFSGVVSGLVGIWKEDHIDEYNTFDMYLESCHNRAMANSNDHK